MTKTVPESFTTHVKVLQHHIDQGVCESAYQCAVALALTEAFPQASGVTVGSRFTVLVIGGRRYETAVRGGMAEFIDRFDDGLSVEPAEFDLTFRLLPW